MQKTIERYRKSAKGVLGNNSKYFEQDMQVYVHSEDGVLSLRFIFVWLNITSFWSWLWAGDHLLTSQMISLWFLELRTSLLKFAIDNRLTPSYQKRLIFCVLLQQWKNETGQIVKKLEFLELSKRWMKSNFLYFSYRNIYVPYKPVLWANLAVFN